MKIINRNLPKLSQVSRPASWYNMVFSIFNIILGAVLVPADLGNGHFFIVTSIFNTFTWGMIFIFLGLCMLFGRVANWWWLMRNVNIPAIFIKLLWVFALILNRIHDPNADMFVILMFAALAFLQIGHYLYFPTAKEAEGPVEVGNITIPKEMLK